MLFGARSTNMSIIHTKFHNINVKEAHMALKLLIDKNIVLQQKFPKVHIAIYLSCTCRCSNFSKSMMLGQELEQYR